MTNSRRDEGTGVTILEFTVPETPAAGRAAPAVEVRLPDRAMPTVPPREPIPEDRLADEDVLGPPDEPLELAVGDATDIDLHHHAPAPAPVLHLPEHPAAAPGRVCT